MKKLQQFYIMKISSNRLEKFDYHLKRLLGNTGAHIREIRNNGDLLLWETIKHLEVYDQSDMNVIQISYDMIRKL